MERALGRRNRAEILGCVPKLQALEMGKNSLRPYGRHYRRVANNANKNNDLCFGMKRRDAVSSRRSPLNSLIAYYINIAVSHGEAMASCVACVELRAALYPPEARSVVE
ncbi:hypothetical protein J6590_002032 [Homalodisca vitripennis]|nr:hypothetical protein J6590_002032 [Homalodisca vitripennis]